MTKPTKEDFDRALRMDGHRIPEPPLNGHTTASYDPDVSPIISQPTAYLMLSALKLVVKMIDMHGASILGTMDGFVRSAMQLGEKEASRRP